MEQTDEKARKDAIAFLLRHKSGVLSTVTTDGQPHASMVYYTADQDFNIYILTLIESRKFAAIEGNPKVAFTVSTPDVPQTLQIEGSAMDITDDPDAARKKQDLFTVLSANPWFYGPITKLDQSMTVVVWLKPQWVRWADYAFAEAGTEHVLKEIKV